ncbi:MAG TPA: hypothetical protein VME18_02540 [Acidobacteriaceae bacterium]|nr:hypothetical protein [Acidobacteriaceae bacterium]
MEDVIIAFSARGVALMLSIIMVDEPRKRLVEATGTAAADLRRIACGRQAPTAGVLAYLGLQQRGEEYIWQA